jgi:hypothetical protein
MKTPIQIDSAVALKLREWFAAGRGVRAWENHDIGGGDVGHLQFTPADNLVSPNWRYVDAGVFTPADILVETFIVRLAYKVKLKAYYWGRGLTKESEAKAKRLCVDGESFFWRLDDNGEPIVEIGKARVEAFSKGV